VAGLGVCVGSAVHGLHLSLPKAVVLQRHGMDRIDHVANIRTLAEAGCDRVLGLGSVGGLHLPLGPGTFLCPDDFIALAGGPVVF
jgi:purine nucleoside phosphorylase